MTDRSALLVTSKELAEELAQQQEAGPTAPRTVVLDVRWSLDAPDGGPAFRAGHVPGAVYVDLESELSGHGAATEGRHPLPGDEALTVAARRWGVKPGDRVVAYDGGGNLAAARAWWLLRDAGVDVRLLDGAWPAWLAAGLPVETGESTPRSTEEITLEGGRMSRLTISEAAEWARDAVLLDARAAERYAGEVEPIDPRAGHIPGARSAPTPQHLDADGRFLSDSELRARFAALGVEFESPNAAGEQGQNPAYGQRVGAYCGSGITASHTLFALELAGVSGALFPGSWSQWSNHPELPVATGAQP